MKQNPTVFLIDDDTDDQEIFSLALEQAHETANCVFANDGMDALEKINSDKMPIPDFIFIDMNMPRMNGRQCLAEIKKIERLKDVPVYIYSTSIDPESVHQNKMLGAVDFIVKPSDINLLAELLSNIIRKRFLPFMIFIFCLTLLNNKAYSQSDTLSPVNALKKLSVEELMNVMVTSVSKTPEKLTEVASAIQVIRSEEINRSTATRLPEALRLATNMQIAQSGSHDWGITSRGFKGAPIRSSSLANKLLVLVDGRTVYTPLFGGVYWDVQNILLNDVDQIEVVSGPGGTLWGANAVNGVVNITSKEAKETQGVYASVLAGTLLKDWAAVRYGSHIDSTFYYRVYAQRFDCKNTTLPGDINANDSWNMTQGGFRMDYAKSDKNKFTLQGDLYGGEEDDTASTLVNGQNILGRWTHSFSNQSALVIQSYFDRTYRNTQSYNYSIDELTTYDIDVQHSFSIGNRNRIVWGGGYRAATSDISTFSNSILPERRTLQLVSGFVQDQISIVPDEVELTLGTKLLHNDYTDFEVQPSVRLAWTPGTKNTVWAAVSRSVRIPTRFDEDYFSPRLSSYGDFKSEKVVAYEAGYRVRPVERISLSFAAFYNQYTDVRSIDTNHAGPPLHTDTTFYFANNLKANTYGIEFFANYIATDWWKLRGGYTFLKEDFTITSSKTYPNSSFFEANDPRNQFLVQSIMDLTKNIQLDFIGRYVDALPNKISGQSIPAYATFDVRIAYTYKWITVSLMGQNLAEKYHFEFGNREIPRRVMGKISVNF